MNLTKDEIGELRERISRLAETALLLYRAEQRHQQAQQDLEMLLFKLEHRREAQSA